MSTAADKRLMKYSIILPTYNERENLPLMASMINEAFEKAKLFYELVIVEDSSPDGTVEVAQELAKVYGTKGTYKSFEEGEDKPIGDGSGVGKCYGSDKIKILKRVGKLGLGSAYVDGLKCCSSDSEFVFLMDADMSHHPRYIPDFIKKQKEAKCDIVTGTRYAGNGGVAGWDMMRVLTSRGANLIANLLLNPHVSDLTGSFRLYKKPVLEDLMNSVKGKTYVFQMEVIVRAKAKNYTVEEVPIIFVDRVFGESKLGAMEIVSYLKGLWNLFSDI